MGNKPKISILLPVYNGEKYLNESISSILNQSFQNFELIVIDDCSTDKSVDVIKSHNDSRIVFLRNSINSRTAHSLNRGIDIAKGKYIARMDQDDIASPTRLEEQYHFMEANPEVGICGTQIMPFGIGINSSTSKYPLSDSGIRLMQLYKPPFAHPTVMMRKAVLNKNKLRYRENFIAEDYSLWSKLLQVTKASNLSSALLRYRIHPSSITKTFYRRLPNEQKVIRVEYANYLFNQKSSFWSLMLNSGNSYFRKMAMNHFQNIGIKGIPRELLEKHLNLLDQYFKKRNRWVYYFNKIKAIIFFERKS